MSETTSPSKGFKGLRVVSFESRRSEQMADLIRRNGGEAIVAPSMREIPLEDNKEALEFGRRYDVLVCHDNAYSDVAYDGYRAPSFLEVPGAMDYGVEFHSLSKTYNMTGWRTGMMVGNRVAVEALGRVKTNVDSGIFDAVQIASASTW